MYRPVRNMMTAAAILFPAAVFLIPGLRPGFFGWLFYGIFLLVTLFVWGIGGKGNRRVSEGFDPDSDNQELDLTRQKLRESSKWNWWSLH